MVKFPQLFSPPVPVVDDVSLNEYCDYCEQRLWLPGIAWLKSAGLVWGIWDDSLLAQSTREA